MKEGKYMPKKSEMDKMCIKPQSRGYLSMRGQYIQRKEGHRQKEICSEKISKSNDGMQNALLKVKDVQNNNTKEEFNATKSKERRKCMQKNILRGKDLREKGINEGKMFATKAFYGRKVDAKKHL